MLKLLLPLLLGALALAVACRRAPEAGPAPAPSSALTTNQQVFQVKGVIVDLNPAASEVRIKHEAIPGYMAAMTMPFEVRNTNELTGLTPGDAVSFRLIVTDTAGWIEQVVKTGVTGTNTASTAPSGLPGEYEPLSAGDPLPPFSLTNQFGQRIDQTRFQGQALAITFIFTRCPFPTFCPLTANNFAEAQIQLLARTTGPTNWQLLTVSFDPEFDRPAVMKAYAEGHRYDPAHWTFATGSLGEVAGLGGRFGLVFWRDDSGSISHNLRTAVIGASGRLQKVIEGNKWTSEELVAELVKAAGN